jgi:general secretion pathway protein E
MDPIFRNSAVPLLNDIFEKAATLDASDIHIEPGQFNTRVRYRVDGHLISGMNIHRSMQQQIISRIKVLAELDISEQRLPQDGRAFTKAGNKEYDLRVSTIPTYHGEKAVIRLLDKKQASLPLEALGIAENDLAAYRHIIDAPQGLIIVCGPTGCGKTTTLYSSLEKVNREPLNIMTIEDPIEYQLPRINQVQVNTNTGLTFSKGLRGILRQDPDIIMIGEIRDAETASIAMRAKSVPSRLKDMGIEQYLVAENLKCAVSQRLVRKFCSSCKGLGCRECNMSGFRGRIGVFEFLKAGETFPERTMMECADALVKNGITSREEIAHNIYVE